jgi:hypothetical protein
MFGGSVGGLHSDIMNAEPESKDSATRLINEIKDRAKSSIKFKDYPSAVKLYDKAVEVSKVAELTANEHAIFFANKSMVLLSMNKGADALEAANLAIATDGTYVKAYYRKAMASIQLCDYSDAAAALESGLALAPDDKELLQQRSKVEELIRSGPIAKPSTSSAAKSTTSTAFMSSSSSSSSSIVPPSTSSASSSSSTSKSALVADKGEDDEMTEKIRGYRIKEDGTKTTFFNRDIDETAKSLIGDIRPKKIDEATAIPVATPAVSGASAWNAAGTYESYDKSPATSSAITTNLTNKLTFTNGEFEFEFSKIDKIEGDSQLTMARGKKKLVYDYTVVVAVIVKSLSAGLSSNCNVNIADITSDLSSEIEVQLANKTGFNSAAVANILKARIKEALVAAQEELKSVFLQ